jgi:trypsin-like peptidase
MSSRCSRPLSTFVRFWFILSSTLAFIATVSAHASGRQIAYSMADRATVRVIAVRGLDMARNQVDGEEIRIAIVNGGHGTGVLVSRDGLVITAYHVIEGCSHVVVSKLNDPSPYLARVLATSPENDVALLSIAGAHEDFVPVPSTTYPLDARQTVFAIGYPLDATRTDPQSSRGIVSGEDPSGLLQLNISINPGNSGGPILDERNRLVGIVVSTRKNAEGIAFAVPVAALRDLVDRLDPKTRTAAHKDSEDKPHADQLLGYLVVAFAQQGHLLGGISAAMDRDHLAAMRSLIEQILGTHYGAPDVLALVAGYLWNEALILRVRGDTEWQARQLRSVAICAMAHRMDVGIDRRSPFVAEVLTLQSSGPPPQLATVPQGAISTVDAGLRSERSNSEPSVQTSEVDPQTADSLIKELAGFRLGWDKNRVGAACRKAGHELTMADGRYHCNGAAESLSYDVVVEFRMCPQKVCQIAVRALLSEARENEWLNRLGVLKAQYERLHGRAERDVRLPSECRDHLFACLQDGSARLEYRWELGRKSVSIMVGGHDKRPEMTVSLSKLR